MRTRYGYVNSIYTIAVGAIDKRSMIPRYAEACSAVMATTFGDSVVTCQSHRRRNCVNNFGETSAAAAMASGIIALALQVNSHLTWRDVQHLIIRSSDPKSVILNVNDNWITNAANLTVHNKVGFGLMNAEKLVIYAEKWTGVPSQEYCSLSPPNYNQRFLSTKSLKFECNSCQIRYLEHVTLKVNLYYTRRGVLVLDLTSPQGTTSRMIHSRPLDALIRKTKFENLLTSSIQFWGEDPTGRWHVSLSNSNYHRDEYDVIHGFMKTYLDTGSTKTPVRGRGLRTTKKNSRYTDNDGDSYECEESQTLPPKKKAKKKILPSNSTMAESHIQHLREKIGKEDKEDISEISTSSSEIEDDSKEIAKLKRLLAKKEEEIKELKSTLKNTEEMRSFIEIVGELKESAEFFKRAKILQDVKHGPSPRDTSNSINQTKKKDAQLLVLDNVRPPSPALSCTSQATTSSCASSEIEADNVTICPNVLVTKGQNTILMQKQTAKDFVYAIMAMLMWTREILSTHSVTGRKSNAHKDADPKPQLDTQKVESICAYVSNKYGCTSSATRQHMTTKINNVIKCCKMQKHKI